MMRNHNQTPGGRGWNKRQVLAGVALLGAAYFSYELGNYNDTPGHFIDYQHPTHAVDAPVGDAKFLYHNVETVAHFTGKFAGTILKAAF